MEKLIKPESYFYIIRRNNHYLKELSGSYTLCGYRLRYDMDLSKPYWYDMFHNNSLSMKRYDMYKKKNQEMFDEFVKKDNVKIIYQKNEKALNKTSRFNSFLSIFTTKEDKHTSSDKDDKISKCLNKYNDIEILVIMILNAKKFKNKKERYQYTKANDNKNNHGSYKKYKKQYHGAIRTQRQQLLKANDFDSLQTFNYQYENIRRCRLKDL